MNPITSEIGATSTKNISDAYNALLSSGNPMQLFMSMAAGRPELQGAVNMLKSGMSPEYVARALMSQRGINPDEFVKQCQRHGKE